jgi:hypothetical protein
MSEYNKNLSLIQSNTNSFLGLDTVTIIVGTGANERSFSIHKKLLAEKSAVFHKLLNGDPSNDDAGSVTEARLPDDDPDVFSLFIEWLYCSTLKTIVTLGERESELAAGIFKAIVLADKYCLTEFGDRLMTIYASRNKLAPLPELSNCYKAVGPQNKFRLYAIRWVAYIILCYADSRHPGCSSENVSRVLETNPELGREVLKAVRNQSGIAQKNPNMAPPCDYHSHAQTAACPYGLPNWKVFTKK